MEIGKKQNLIKAILALSLSVGLFLSPKSFAQMSLPESAPDSDLMWDIREWSFPEEEVKPNYDLADEQMVRKDGHIYALKAENIPQEARALYYAMDPETQAKFHKIRLGLLSKFATALDKNALMMGAVVVSKNKILGVFKKGKKVEGSLREIGRTSVENILNGLNAKLWNEARKVADAKEVSFVFNPAAGAFVGIPKKIHAGGILGFGLNVGYNVESDVLFVAVNGTVEKIKSGFVVFVGARFTAGLQFDASPTPGIRLGENPFKKSRLLHKERAQVTYPIYVPFWDASGEGRYGLGISGSFSIPGEFFYYTNDNLALRLIRLDLPTQGLWRFIYGSLAKLGASDSVLVGFAKRAQVEFIAKSCGGLFL